MNGNQSTTQPQRRDIILDRRTGRLQTPDFRSAAHAFFITKSHKALAPFEYLGVSRVHALFKNIIRLESQTVAAEGDWQFRFSSNHYYWNRMLAISWFMRRQLTSFRANFLTFCGLSSTWVKTYGSGLPRWKWPIRQTNCDGSCTFKTLYAVSTLEC